MKGYMGRKKIYKTKKEKYEAELRWKREHYHRNKEIYKKRRMENYWREKNVGEKLS